DLGGRALSVREVVPRLAERVVVDEAVEDGRQGALERPVLILDRVEPEPVGELVQGDREEVDVQAVIVVEAEIERGTRQAACLAEGAVELRRYVDRRAVEVRAGEPVRERLDVPGSRDGGAREIGPDGVGVGLTEDAGRRGARKKGGKARAHPDRDGAREETAPDGGGLLEHDEALLAERRARIPAHGRDRSGVVEAGSRRVRVDDDDVRRKKRPGGERSEEKER